MTVNERLYAKGLMDEFDKSKTNYQTGARHIISWLRDDETSIEKTLNNSC